MRVPLPIAILLCLAVVAAVWWGGTRHHDFSTPPSDAELADLAARVKHSLPRADDVQAPVEEPVERPAPPPAPTPDPPAAPEPPKIDPGDLATLPGLTAYRDAPSDAAALIELASLLENEGHFRHALSAWERVLDLARPDVAQSAAASAAIRRLAPTLPHWNVDPQTAIPVTLHAGTGKTLAKPLQPVLEELARKLEDASSGILKVEVKIATGKNTGPSPVAIWLDGNAPKPSSTEVLSFTVASPEELGAHAAKTVYLLVRSHLSKRDDLTTPAEIAEGGDALDALSSQITRLSWLEFGEALNRPPAAE